jgi:hypothetical protein
MPPSDIAWIIGAGTFGNKAAQTLLKNHDPSTILVVDHDELALAKLSGLRVGTLKSEATDFLVRNLLKNNSPNWIIPCVPYHLAWEWLLGRLGPKASPITVPDTCRLFLPQAWPTQRGGYAVSYADFICPPDCPEPQNICTHTGLPRPGLLYKELERLHLAGYYTMVLRSRQIAPGLGGCLSRDLLELEKEALTLQGHLLLATACKCHGVINALAVSG